MQAENRGIASGQGTEPSNKRKEQQMYVRLTTWVDATNIDGGLDYLRSTALPIIRQQRGYRGLSASVDRATAAMAVLSLWDSESDRDASESSVEKARDEASDIIGGTMSIEKLEELVLEIVKAPGPGAALMVTPFSMDPATIDDNIAFFKSEIVPSILAAPGICAVRNLVNRSTGEGYVGTIWADRADMDAEAGGAAARRELATSRGITFGEIMRREIALTDTP